MTQNLEPRDGPKRKKTRPRQNWGTRFLKDMQTIVQSTKTSKTGSAMTELGQLGLDLDTYQVDPLGSWYGAEACHAFVTANGAAAMGP